MDASVGQMKKSGWRSDSGAGGDGKGAKKEKKKQHWVLAKEAGRRVVRRSGPLFALRFTLMIASQQHRTVRRSGRHVFCFVFWRSQAFFDRRSDRGRMRRAGRRMSHASRW